MADFSQKYHPLFKDSSSSVIPPTSPIKTMGFLEEPNIINAATPFSQFYQPDEHFDDFPDNVCVHETGTCSPQSSKAIDNNCTSGGTKIKCPNSSPNPLDKVEQVSQLVHFPIHNKKRKNKERPSSTSSQSNKNNTSMKEMKGKKQKKDKKKATEETPTGYIHVRARRGQATDSHSLAERVRREKISERMKILQGLVPGCDKVNGKALMLEEIINYVQSLQHQVEFLSMKLANVNPMYCDFGMDVDTLPITTKQRLTALASLRPLPPPPPPPSMRPCNATHQIPMPNTLNSPTTSSIFGFFDNSALLPIQQEHLTNISTRGSGQLLWDFDEQTIQKPFNQQLSEFTSY